MASMPDFEAGARDAIDRERRRIHGFADHLHHLGRHHDQHDAPQPPASHPAPVTAAPASKENPMGISTLENDVKNDLTDGLAYVEGMVARLKAAAPGIIATSETVANSTIGKIAEKVAELVIPAPYEGMLVDLVEDFAKRYGQPAATAPGAPAEPAATPPAQQ